VSFSVVRNFHKYLEYNSFKVISDLCKERNIFPVAKERAVYGGSGGGLLGGAAGLLGSFCGFLAGGGDVT